jgi:hypothetical protein
MHDGRRSVRLGEVRIILDQIGPAHFDAVAMGFTGYLDAGGVKRQRENVSFDVDLALEWLIQWCHEALLANVIDAMIRVRHILSLNARVSW